MRNAKISTAKGALDLRGTVGFFVSSEALLDSASEFGNEDKRYKEGRWGMSAFDKRTGRVSAHLLGRASSVFRSKRQKGGKQRTEGELQRGALKKALKGDLNKGSPLGEFSSAIIYMI